MENVSPYEILFQSDAIGVDRLLFENVLQSITDGFFIIDKTGNILFWNKSATNMMLGNPGEIITGQNLWEKFPELKILKEHPYYQKVLTENSTIHFKEYFPSYKIWAEVSVYPSEKSITVYFKDITEVVRLRKLESLEREVLEMNTSPDSKLTQILDFYLSAIQEIHAGMLCSVLKLENGRLYNWSSKALPDNYVNAINGKLIGDNEGSCGTAAFRKEKVVVSDIENDIRWKDYKEIALQNGLRACWSFPIINSANQVIGTFAIYYQTVKYPSIEEENTIERGKNLLLIILENKLAQENIRISNQRYDLVAKATNDIIWEWDLEMDEIICANDGFGKVFGYNPQKISSDLMVWKKWIHPEDFQRVVDKRTSILSNPYHL